jgi:hypothetical protein
LNATFISPTRMTRTKNSQQLFILTSQKVSICIGSRAQVVLLGLQDAPAQITPHFLPVLVDNHVLLQEAAALPSPNCS